MSVVCDQVGNDLGQKLVIIIIQIMYMYVACNFKLHDTSLLMPHACSNTIT